MNGLLPWGLHLFEVSIPSGCLFQRSSVWIGLPLWVQPRFFLPPYTMNLGESGLFSKEQSHPITVVFSEIQEKGLTGVDMLLRAMMIAMMVQ